MIYFIYYRKESTYSTQELSKKKKEKSVNAIPKESNLTEDRIKVATNVMLISQKHHCDEYERPCYINNTNHLHLTPQHLSTWAASIVRFISYYVAQFICVITCYV